jgi:hypothetical protein
MMRLLWPAARGAVNQAREGGGARPVTFRTRKVDTCRAHVYAYWSTEYGALIAEVPELPGCLGPADSELLAWASRRRKPIERLAEAESRVRFGRMCAD